MSHVGVDADDMPDPILDEATIEAFLSGRTAGPDLPAVLVAFADDLRIVTSGPAPVPTGELAAFLAGAGATSPDGGVVEAKRPRRLLATLAAMGVVAKVGLGLGVAAASVVGAGAAGVLPTPVQRAVATAVDSVTPFEFPDKADVRPNPGRTVATDATGASDGPPGLDGTAVPATTTDEPGPNPGPDATRPGATGLEQANTTPAAGHVPSSVPAATHGAGATGLEQANTTPAAGHVPTSLPAPAAGASIGSRRADGVASTPGARNGSASEPGPPASPGGGRP